MKQSLSIVILASLLAVVGCVDRAAQSQAKKTQALVTDPTIAVQVASSTSADLDETVEVTGAFTTSEQSTVGANVGGRLTAVYVKDGDAVTAGQLIAQIESTDALTRVRQAQSQVDSARASYQQALSDARVGPSKSSSNVRAAESRLAQAKSRYEKAKNGSRPEERAQAEWTVKRSKSDMETAKSALDRAQRLFDEGAIAKADLETAQNKFDNAQAAYNAAIQAQQLVLQATRPEDLEAAKLDVTAAQEAVRLAKADQGLDVTFKQRVDAAKANLASAQEQVRLAQKALQDTSIRSPFSGRVSGKPLQAGTYAAPGATVATIIGSTGTYFEANVPESKVDLIVPGTPVEITVEALKGAKLSGHVIAINPIASGQGRLFTVRVSIDQTMNVRPGMFAKASIKLGERRGVTVVPNVAVIRDGENSYLFIVEGDKAKRVDVHLGIQNGDIIEVTGLGKGEKVVVSGQTSLVDGAKVKVETGKKES